MYFNKSYGKGVLKEIKFNKTNYLRDDDLLLRSVFFFGPTFKENKKKNINRVDDEKYGPT